MSASEVGLWKKIGVKSGFEEQWARWLSKICRRTVTSDEVNIWTRKRWSNKTAMWAHADELDKMQNNIASCCACCFCTRTGRRHGSFRFSQFHLHLHCRAGSGHEYHRCHAFPLLRSNAHIQYLTDRVDGLITDSTNSPFTRNILPYVYLENPDQKLKWNVYSFDEGIASRVPYESAARVLPQSKRSFAGYTVRQG